MIQLKEKMKINYQARAGKREGGGEKQRWNSKT